MGLKYEPASEPLHLEADAGHLAPSRKPQVVQETPSKLKSYRGTSLIRNRTPLGPHSRTMPEALWWSWGGGAVSYPDRRRRSRRRAGLEYRAVLLQGRLMGAQRRRCCIRSGTGVGGGPAQDTRL